MKRILTFILVFLVICATLIFCASCYSTASGGLLYTEVDGGYQVTGVSITKGRFSTPIIVIPREFNGKPVIAISDGAFTGYTGLTKIEIPDTVKYIGVAAFSGCISLSEIVIPNSVTYIGDSAFVGCINLSEITIPDSVAYLGESALAACTNLKSVKIGDSVTEILYSTFSDCNSLTNVTLGKGITSIEEGAFENCPNIAYNEYGNAVYLGNEENPYNVLVRAKNVYIESCEIHPNTQVISDSAFCFSVPISSGVTESVGCEYLSEIVIPDSVIFIGDRAFFLCSSLGSLTFGENSNLKSIGEDAFMGCYLLKHVSIPSSVTYLGKGIFDWCNLLEFNEYDNAYYLGNEENPYHILFKPKSKNIKSCTIHEDTKIIYSLSNCANIEKIEIPDSVVFIGNEAFNNCSSLFSVKIPNSVTSIGQCGFANCTALEWIELGDSIETIGYAAFESCTSLMAVSIPDSVTSIDSFAFYGCSSLMYVNISKSVISIGMHAFTDCTYLKQIIIPASVEYMDARVFVGCDDIVICCELFTQPAQWDPAWNLKDDDSIFLETHIVLWGYTGE